jgi:uncharacterized protein (TIGR03382 family)
LFVPSLSLKISSFDGDAFFNSSATNDGTGNNTVNIATPSQTATFAAGTGPEGFAYVHGGNPDFSADSVIVAEQSAGDVATYQIDANGDPITSTRQVLVSGLTSPNGMVIDPVTGDLLFDDYSADLVYEIQGFTGGKPTPAPSALFTLGAGLLPGLAALSRRRRR